MEASTGFSLSQHNGNLEGAIKALGKTVADRAILLERSRNNSMSSAVASSHSAMCSEVGRLYLTREISQHASESDEFGEKRQAGRGS